MMKLQAAKGPIVELDPTSVLDIRTLIIDGVDLSPHRAIPDDGDPRIDHSLEGFLFTCGPDHIRHPEPIGDGSDRRYPLHGSFSSHPATILHQSDSECRAEIPVRHADGGQSLLERHWRIDAQTGVVALRDRITNSGHAPFPAMLMYHMNVAAKLFDDAVRLEGAMLDDGGFGWRFGAEPGGVFCVAASGDTAGADGWAEFRLGPIASVGGLTLVVRFDTASLPFLQIWRNQQAPANVVGIEPVSHRWVGREDLAKGGELDMLAPGESREFGLDFFFM
ncbi:aldose 1-epimerase family protein [Agrobacterium vitis]